MENFDTLRPYLFSIAYRMLGTAMDAEDVLQDAYVRWSEADRTNVRSPKAFLATVVTRLCLNRLTSARAERESYIGVWLPEPLLTGDDPMWSSPEGEVGAKETLSMAFMLLLESLSPDERAVYVLRAVFDYEYAEIADTVGKSAANCRQLFHRAREKVTQAREIDRVTTDTLTGLADAMAAAFSSGDMAVFTNLLTEDVLCMTDSNGKVRGAGTRLIQGATAVAAVLRVMFLRAIEEGAVTEMTEVNGQPGFLSRVNGEVLAVGSIEMRGGKITRFMYMLNPDKLRRINAGG